MKDEEIRRRISILDFVIKDAGSRLRELDLDNVSLDDVSLSGDIAYQLSKNLMARYWLMLVLGDEA